MSPRPPVQSGHFPACCPSSGSRRQEARRLESWEGAAGGHTGALLRHRNIFWRTTGERCSLGCVEGAASSSSKAEKENSLQAGAGGGGSSRHRDSHQLASVTRARASNGNVWEGNTTPPIQILPTLWSPVQAHVLLKLTLTSPGSPEQPFCVHHLHTPLIMVSGCRL